VPSARSPAPAPPVPASFDPAPLDPAPLDPAPLDPASLDPTVLDAEAAGQLLGAIRGLRWFAGKGRRARLTGLTRLPWVTPPATWPAVRLEIAEITYPDGPAPTPYELYSLPVAYWPAPQSDLQAAELVRLGDPDLGPVVGYDALRDPAGRRAILEALVEQRHLTGDGAEVTFRLTTPAALTADLEPRVFGGQQSNTSLLLGDVAMLKLFRRLELGPNLDIEVHEALGRSHLRDIAALYGWVRGSWQHRGESVSADLAMVVEQLPEARDGWELALESLRVGSSFVAAAARLGTGLAETHAALRDTFRTGHRAGAELAEQMTDRLREASRHAPQLEPYAPGLERVISTLGGRDLPTQRVHGDFHLGQTLHTPDGWKIIDFEGEPAKSLAERAAPDSGWRDVAGMLRSFAYAAATAARSAGSPADLAGHETWVSECRDAFLTAYAGGPLPEAEDAVLRAYEADKAIYEVVYEVRNRPDWVEIPLGAIAALDGSADPTPTGTAKE